MTSPSVKTETVTKQTINFSNTAMTSTYNPTSARITSSFSSTIDTTNTSPTTASLTAITETTNYTTTTTTNNITPPTPITLPYNSSSCNDTSLIPLKDGTCVSTGKAHDDMVDLIHDNTNLTTTDLVYLLTIYYTSVARSNSSLNSNKSLTPNEIDDTVGRLNESVIINATTSFIMSISPNQINDSVLGALFRSELGGNSIFQSNTTPSLNTYFSVAVTVDVASLVNVTYLNMLLIDKPNDFARLNDSMNRILVSSVIVTKFVTNNAASNPMNINLYFTKQFNNVTDISPDHFLCVYYDNNSLSWNNKGCSKPTYNSKFDRYECNCNHLTSFALIWLPSSGSDSTLRAEDIASLVFQSISIICFLAIIAHSIVTRLINPMGQLQAINFLPVISCASTVLLFIFFIALVLTVNTKTQPSDGSTCFTSASILMFFVYFLLLFMFCVKTTIGYFNYVRFVLLFPAPSFKQLYILLILSFIISITAVAFTIGFNSNSSYGISELYAYRNCWFRKDLIHYFLTIPIGIFLLLNLCVLVLIAKRIIDHARNATARHNSFKRMRRCVLLLMSSSISQGIGWLIGPFLLVFPPVTAQILAWVFVICNALEGLWSVLLYIIIQQQHMDDQRHIIAKKDLAEMKRLSMKKHKQMYDDNRIKGDGGKREYQTISRYSRSARYWLDDHPKTIDLDMSTSEYDA